MTQKASFVWAYSFHSSYSVNVISELSLWKMSVCAQDKSSADAPEWDESWSSVLGAAARPGSAQWLLVPSWGTGHVSPHEPLCDIPAPSLPSPVQSWTRECSRTGWCLPSWVPRGWTPALQRQASSLPSLLWPKFGKFIKICNFCHKWATLSRATDRSRHSIVVCPNLVPNIKLVNYTEACLHKLARR